MHFAIAWNISAVGINHADVEQRIVNTISMHPRRYRPMNNYWIVQVYTPIHYNQVVASIQQINIDGVNIIITPLMTGGQYGGMLPSIEYWQNINSLSS